MTPPRRLPARAMLVGAMLALSVGVRARAQSLALSLSGGSRDSISPAPVIGIVATDVPANLGPAFIRLFVSLNNPFQSPFFSRLIAGTSAQIVVDSLFPSGKTIYLRSQLLDQSGNVRAQRVDTANVRSWLRLVAPSHATEVFFTRTPEFVWSSPAISLPPGPWSYRVDIINSAHPDPPEHSFRASDTSAVSPVPLDACTSYRLAVTAVADNSIGSSDHITVKSPGTFSIQSPECPSATISYQNFPNPFGHGTGAAKTCFWFDIAHRTAVKLTIYDIRLHPVKRLVPGRFLPAVLDSGAYGRRAGEQSGCDPSLQWDGTDDAGRSVPQGVYIAVFEADGKRETKKLFYRGP